MSQCENEFSILNTLKGQMPDEMIWGCVFVPNILYLAVDSFIKITIA